MAAQVRARIAEPDQTIIWEAQPRQAAFIACPVDDVAFGGARGGGKSDAVIGDWIGHEDQFSQHAIGMAFRRERTQLTELIERAKQVLKPLGHVWHEKDSYFTGPRGGRLRFTYLENDSDADAYQGHSYTRLYPEEMGTFPNESPINKLFATLRSGNGVKCQMKGTCNPGGSGHQWVKARYKLDEYPEGGQIFRTTFTNPFTKESIEQTRVFIASRVADNRYLGTDYVAKLYQVGSTNLVRAWLSGDWSVIEGAFFDGWDITRHVVKPFPIPKHWARLCSGDWGYAKPFSFGWWAVAGEPTLAGNILIPRGCLVRYREWYGKTAPNIGVRMDAEDVAKEIKRIEQDEQIDKRVLDPSTFAENGGPSIAERMFSSHGIGFFKADNTRVSERGAMSGWDALRGRLHGDDDGNPMVVCFDTCRDSIRTIPALQHDTLRPEDLDTDGEDHAADDWRYACNARPWVKEKPKSSEPPRFLHEITAAEIFDLQGKFTRGARPERV